MRQHQVLLPHLGQLLEGHSSTTCRCGLPHMGAQVPCAAGRLVKSLHAQNCWIWTLDGFLLRSHLESLKGKPCKGRDTQDAPEFLLAICWEIFLQNWAQFVSTAAWASITFS